MFSDKQILAYRSIRAPEEIRESVVRGSLEKSKRSSGNRAPRLAAMAAALVLILGLGLFFSPETEFSVAINGEVLEQEMIVIPATPANEMRSSPTVSLPVEIQTGKETKILVSQGVLLSEEKEARKEIIQKGTISFVWEVLWEDGEKEPRMEITSEEGNTVIILIFDNAQNKILIKELKE